jgi:type II secretory pathway pseudopilin PulG
VKRKAKEGNWADPQAGMTKVEVVVVIGVIAAFVLLAVMMPNLNARVRAKVERVRCVDNLKHIGLAFRISASANGDHFPAELMLSNGVEIASIETLNIFESLKMELSTPKILWCPAEKVKKGAETFTGFSAKNISYFASLTARSTSGPRTFLAGDRHLATNGIAIGAGLFGLTTNGALTWSKELDPDHGNILKGDGSVHQFNNATLESAVRNQEVATNWLVFP